MQQHGIITCRTKFWLTFTNSSATACYPNYPQKLKVRINCSEKSYAKIKFLNVIHRKMLSWKKTQKLGNCDCKSSTSFSLSLFTVHLHRFENLSTCSYLLKKYALKTLRSQSSGVMNQWNLRFFKKKLAYF